jgi:hypothetical protein
MDAKLAELLESQHADGARARNILNAAGGLYSEREAEIINELIMWFLSEDWDESRAIRYIAALTENRTQREKLEYQARKGAEAQLKLMTQPTA